MRSALETVEGVETVTVDYQAKTATVKARAGTDSAALCAALEAAGYGATVRSG